MSSRIEDADLHASSVRSREEPLGIATKTKNQPWSSCGTKPVGVSLNRLNVRRMSAANAMSTAHQSRRPSMPTNRLKSLETRSKPSLNIRNGLIRSSRGVCRSSTPDRAGLRLNELNAEIPTEKAMVSANWLYSWPAIPGMNAVGTNTAISTAVVATIGGVTSRIAARAASRRPSPESSWRSTFSTTTIASSTTRPTASTSPRSVRVLIENPKAASTAKVATSDTGIAMIGMIVVRQLWRNTKTTITTSPIAWSRVTTSSCMLSLT